MVSHKCVCCASILTSSTESCVNLFGGDLLSKIYNCGAVMSLHFTDTNCKTSPGTSMVARTPFLIENILYQQKLNGTTNGKQCVSINNNNIDASESGNNDCSNNGANSNSNGKVSGDITMIAGGKGERMNNVNAAAAIAHPTDEEYRKLMQNDGYDFHFWVMSMRGVDKGPIAGGKGRNFG